MSDELRALAARLIGRLDGHTLQATALVHEAWLKLAGREPGGGWDGRAYFLAVAAKAMRQVLVNHARDRRAQKRGDDAMRVTSTMRSVRSLRSFGGLSIEQVAAALGVGITTVKADWRFARAWLRREFPDGRDS